MCAKSKSPHDVRANPKSKAAILNACNLSSLLSTNGSMTNISKIETAATEANTTSKYIALPMVEITFHHDYA